MKVLFIHGLASSGAYKTADTLRRLLRPCEVISPDVPINPDDALEMLDGICHKDKPDLIVGLSLGGFWAQKLRGYRKILINPEFRVSEFMRPLIGEMKYLSPRQDGAESFFITEEICDGYARLEATEFDGLTDEEISLTRGMFAIEDELVHCYDTFEEHYPGQGIKYHGKHLPTYPEIKENLLPLVERNDIQQ